MATTKKTVKSDATDKKKTTASKKTTTKKKTTKKKVESTGVVDEFLNENIGGVVTMAEESQEPPQEIVTKYAITKVSDENYDEIKVIKPVEDGENNQDEYEKNTDENKLMDAEAELSEILYQQHMEEVNKAIEGDNKQSEEFKENWEELGLTEELQSDIQKTVSELYKENQEIRKVDVKDDKPKNIAYPPTEEKNETQEQKKANTVDDLRVNLQPKNEPQRFVYVNTSMGVKYD